MKQPFPTSFVASVTVAAVLWLGACAPGDELPTASASSRIRNLLLVTIDTLRADHVGALGYGRDVSPNLDRLARTGAVFTQAIAQSSWTRASMASVMTGLLPTTVGLTCHNFRIPKAECDILSPSAVTLAEVLAQHQFQTAGVVANINVDPAFGFDQGFAEYFVVSSRLARQDPDWRLKSDWLNNTTREVTETALGWLDRHAADPDPFLLYLHYLDPHDPYDPPHSLRARFDPRDYDVPALYREEMALYDGEIRAVDDGLGRVLDRLDQLGLTETTAIVVFSDHGEEFGEHGATRHGFTMFDEQLRVPLILALPGLTPPGASISQQVRLLDLMPTVLEALGVPAPDGLQGTSLVPLALGELPPAQAAVSEWGYTPLVAWRFPPWKLIHDTDRGTTWLFDLARDPEEHNDLSRQHPEITARLLAKLQATRTAARQDGEVYRTVSGTVQLSDEQIEQLRALGYVGDAED